MIGDAGNGEEATVNVEVVLGAGEMEPIQALVVYGTTNSLGEMVGQPYVATAPLLEDPQKPGVVETGVWQPVSEEFVQQLATQLGVNLPREVLPASILCRTHDVLSWWSPPRKRTLFFKHSDLRALEGEDLPVPGLVWRFDTFEGKLYVRAYAGADRPGPNTPLAYAPFLNVESTGLVCQGTMKRPASVTPAAATEWEEAFFNASQASQLASIPIATTYGNGRLAPMWLKVRRNRPFPNKFLLTTGERLADFLGVR
ncbi:MAG TPA: hypothetical protein VFR37_08510 [Longimicrobium sp.]|nr:hypothetical protein [Longimicrobium sp.]